MKIQNDQIQSLQQQGEARVKPKAAEGFDSLLTGQIGSVQTAENSAAPLSSPVLSPAILSQSGLVSGIAEDDGQLSLDSISRNLESILGSMDAYAAGLADTSSSDLKGAYGILQDMNRNLQALKEAAPDLGSRHAGLAGMVNELEVFTATETFKFNRGDYL